MRDAAAVRTTKGGRRARDDGRCDDVPSGDEPDGRYTLVGATDDARDDDDDDARDDDDDAGEGRRKSARVRSGRREEDDDDDARGVDANGATRTGRGDAKREDG